jgi:diguanylate cyclase (GGDEF)-like protein
MELSQDTLLAILAAVLIADVVVVAVALIWTQIQRRRNRDEVAPPPVQPAPRTATGATPVMSRPFPAASAPATASAGYAGPGGAIPASNLGVAAAAPAAPGGASVSGPYGSGSALNPNDTTIDPLTGLLTAGAWTRNVVDEEARIRRYHRPATVVILEVEGLDRLIARLGPASVERIVPAVADTIRRGAREADHVARVGTGRFAVLMPETDEILAINYIERVRKACDLWLESGAVSLRLAIGWASSTGDGSLVDAEALATDRMYAELRRVARSNGDAGGPVASGSAGAGLGPDLGAQTFDGGVETPAG